MAGSVVVGIDLGTTNSSVGVLEAGRPRLIAIEGSVLLPSVVGLDPAGGLVVGLAARNQRHLYPERTVSSIKRSMGSAEKVALGDRSYTPTEISAMILRRLKQAAEADLGSPVSRAVITVPAFFSDAQRTATREAGELAGFTVERILNEPTAAALCYTEDDDTPRTLLVYDLGGGTFDVSIVRTRGEVTEVLSSHGDTRLGGDDFDRLLFDELRRRFEKNSGPVGEAESRVRARLTRAAEAAKIGLSSAAHVRVTEEHLAERGGVPVHLDTELDRDAYVGMIDTLLHRTLDSVHFALDEAGIQPRDLDDAILVGGATRTPAVGRLLHDLLGLAPRCDVNPDEAVALGAALQAARIGGAKGSRILVDVTPYSFGAVCLGEVEGRISPHAHHIIIRRNTPLPARQEEILYTLHDGQPAVDVELYQGEAEDVRDNLHLGGFRMDGLDPKARSGSPLVYALSLDLNGILHVEVTEKRSGLRQEIRLENAFRALDPAEFGAARARIDDLMGEVEAELAPISELDLPSPPPDLSGPDRAAFATALALLEKCMRLLPDLEDADATEVQELSAGLSQALTDLNLDQVRARSAALADVLFYLE